MTIFGEIERFLSEDVYPYRVPVTIALGLLAVALLALAYRARWHLWVWRHRLLSSALAVVFLATAIPTGDYFLSPLWERSHLEEPSPLVIADVPTPTPEAPGPTPTPAAPTPAVEQPTPSPTAEPTEPPFEPRVTYEGEFTGADDFHFGRGNALLIETAPGVFTLRFEEFSVRNGPDLYVYLSPSAEGYADGFLDLGRLKATDGAFNYEVPPGTDVSRFASAIVWCRQFAVLFAVAPLTPAG